MDLTNQQAHPVDANREVNKEQALQLRISGASYRQIARTLGMSVSNAHLLVTEGLNELRSQNEELTEELRRVELARLDAMLLALWERRKEARVADSILRIMERRSKLLGLDAPMKWEGSGPGGGPIPVSGSFDLRNLTIDELRQLEKIVERAGVVLQPPAATPQLPAATGDTMISGKTSDPTPAASLPSEPSHGTPS